MNMTATPAPELLVFTRVAPAPELFFHGSALAQISVRFHTLIFSTVFLCLKSS